MSSMRSEDLAFLFAPVAGDDPCGPDLEYDARFVALGIAARPIAAAEIGRAVDGVAIVRPGSTPDWDDVLAQSRELLSQTKDLRIACIVVRAMLESHGLVGSGLAFGAVARMVDDWWDRLHPRTNGSGAGPDARVEAFDAFLDDEGLVSALRTLSPAPGAGSPTLGELGGGIDGGIEAPSLPPTIAREVCRQVEPVVTALDELTQALARHGVDCPAPIGVIRTLLSRTLECCTARHAAPSDRDGTVLQASPDLRPLRSRSDARVALDQIARWLERSEPGHPAPLLIRRAERLLDMSFLEIVADLAPDSLPAIRGVAGIRDNA